MSALAGTLAAVIALVAYLRPPPAPAQPPPSHSADVVESTPAATQPPATEPSTSPTPTAEPSTAEPPAVRPTQEAGGSAAPLSAVRPGGCDDAAAALAAYRRNAGSARSTQAAAAHQAYLDLMGAVLDAQGVVGQKISRLAAEFQELYFRLSGMNGGDPNQVITDINADMADLGTLCQPA
ncbi:unnamed protein product [[Actinomadura] parvosata subsp. kistnae]|uniref:DUF732 domain-containing protein n=1 Tax=[Actinomadura] parvosata subsp. kistnae TaxID=1909395 RepID=A0A1V0A832_9ACTN|nr:hypothetical protein BKM31_37080 [Nonomuraea sp. ATCC 55076]SPL95652.1 unnamed protein product [Actinomadura parvosata subsp. kistnae]